MCSSGTACAKGALSGELRASRDCETRARTQDLECQGVESTGHLQGAGAYPVNAASSAGLALRFNREHPGC